MLLLNDDVILKVHGFIFQIRMTVPDTAVSGLFSIARLVTASDSRPLCVVPVTPGLERRPSWLALIVLFFSEPMRNIWTKLTAGFFIGIAADTTSNRIAENIVAL